MRTKPTAGMVVAVLLATGIAACAQRDGGPAMRPGAGPEGQAGRGPGMPPPGSCGMNAEGRGPGCSMGRGGKAGCPGMMGNRDALKRAGASEAQIQALEDAAFAQQIKQIDLRAAVEKAEVTLEHLMTGSPSDEKAVMQAVDALNQARGELFKADTVARLKVKQVLGEEVLLKLREQGPRRPMDRPGEDPANARREMPANDAGIRPPQER